MNWISQKNIVGKCLYHRRVLSKRQVKRKDCLNKSEGQCKHLRRDRNHAFWSHSPYAKKVL